jgi:hypothetical protein
VEYIREAELTGTEIGLQDTVTISMTDRGIVEYVPINSSALSDTDEDGLPDDLEQQIIDDDPNDGIVGYGDVLPGDDYDGDGESNQVEYDNGTDPTDARSANSVENVYATFHFEIFREAEQTAAGVFEPLSWGVELLCWPREGHEITSGNLTKPSGTSGPSTVDLDITGEGDEAEYWKDDYSSLSELMDDMVGGTYKVHLQVASGVTGTYDLRCKLNVPSYEPGDFPDYVRIEKPAPSANRVSTTPLLDFDTSTWDYVEIFEAHSGAEAYFHYRDAEDDPADTHQITKEYALPPGRHLLGVDVNHGGSSWLGSKTAIEIITQGNVVTPWQMLLLGD